MDVYEINPALERLHNDEPERTERALEHPKINVIWHDGRSGMATNPKRYDIISQQPLYALQAGSSLLFSREYMLLVKRRLKPGGVFAAYSWTERNAAQQHLVRKTVKSVFRHVAKFGATGYLLVASDEPLDLDLASWEDKAEGDGTFYEEVRLYRERRHRSLLRVLDPRRYDDDQGERVVLDDHPLIEYPSIVHQRVPAPLAPVFVHSVDL